MWAWNYKAGAEVHLIMRSRIWCTKDLAIIAEQKCMSKDFPVGRTVCQSCLNSRDKAKAKQIRKEANPTKIAVFSAKTSGVGFGKERLKENRKFKKQRQRKTGKAFL
jgi:hypothetical protein